MTHANRTRLQVEALEDRTVPSALGTNLPAAFRGLDVAVTQFYPTDPCRVVSPVFALNYGETTDRLHAQNGLGVAVTQLIPGNPCLVESPVFFGLAGSPSPGGIDSTVV